MPTPLESAYRQEEPPRKSVIGTLAKGALVAGAGVYGRGLFARGLNKANAKDVAGTFTAGISALKGDYGKAKSAATAAYGELMPKAVAPAAPVSGKLNIVGKGVKQSTLPLGPTGVPRKGYGARLGTNKWTSVNPTAAPVPSGSNNPLNNALQMKRYEHASNVGLSALPLELLRDLNAACDEVVDFEHDATGRFIAKPKEKEGMSTGAKIATGAGVAGLIGAGIVAGRGGQYLGSRGAYKGGLTADNVKRTFRVGSNLIKGDANSAVRAGRSALNTIKGKLASSGGEAAAAKSPLARRFAK